MCMVSAVMDSLTNDWLKRAREMQSSPGPYIPTDYPRIYTGPINPLTQEEVDQVRKLIEEAKKYDEVSGQPDCELESKKLKLLELAKELGVTINWLT